MSSHQKIIITGGAGYIGNSVVQALPKDSEIIIIDNFHIDTPHKRVINEQLIADRNVTLIDANVSQVDAYKEAIVGSDVLIYMASLNSYKEANGNPTMYLNENNLNMQVFLDAVSTYSPTITKAILTSTRGVYGEGAYVCDSCGQRVYPDLAETLTCPMCGSEFLTASFLVESDLPHPSSQYGVTKKIQEELMRMYAHTMGIDLDIFRIFNVYGKDQGLYYSNIGILPQMFEQIKNNKSIYMSGNGEVARDFIAITDIMEVLLQSIADLNARKNAVEIYNLGSGMTTTISDLASAFEQLGYEFTKNKKPEFGDIHFSVANNQKLQHAFGKTKFANILDFVKQEYPHL